MEPSTWLRLALRIQPNQRERQSPGYSLESMGLRRQRARNCPGPEMN